jgi:hypothetical protein
LGLSEPCPSLFASRSLPSLLFLFVPFLPLKKQQTTFILSSFEEKTQLFKSFRATTEERKPTCGVDEEEGQDENEKEKR